MNWHAVYTNPRWEKKVATRIAGKGLEVYCPLNKVRRRWSDRYKVVEEPLFKSYVFVRIAEINQQMIKQIDGVVNFVYAEGRLAIIREREIELIKKFLREYQEVRVAPLSLNPGDKVRVKSGLFMDNQGIVMDVKNKTVAVFLETLGYELTASFDLASLEPALIIQSNH